MGENSIRERIILADKTILEGLRSNNIIKTVKRTMQTYKDLQQFAGTQLPVAALVGDLPDPTNHISSQTGQVDKCQSILSNNVYVYFQAYEDQDTVLSNLADDFWIALYTDPTRGGLCYFTEVKINPNHEYWDPYVAFQMKVIHHYEHDIGGI